ncbi:MOSC domain-containing protein [Coralloluteibacterium stylophorae]|uniref:MOSC domain-containing protein n=1 Tax=Coralloluteibacterium stylophorae TaxID=1776034 RepID=A0A8J7VSP5_9GAMM|nr:MOSC domain-containing protein [Coralloluteibacterium stylophorae]MBS7456429.1 MOSC domain-containing protein [Coralloluteibacterium stylophorae]
MRPTRRPPADSPLGRLLATLPRPGRIEWIGLRPARDVPMHEVEAVAAVVGAGLDGDRYRGTSGARDVSLVQAEHLPVVATLAGLPRLEPARLRRNLVVSGIPLAALRGRRFRIGDDVVLEGTGPCDPCSRMELALGRGGYNAMRGHGGLVARIVATGVIRVGDAVRPVDDAPVPSDVAQHALF